MILLGFDIPLREENIVIDNINILITVLFTIDMLLKVKECNNYFRVYQQDSY